ncbi:MAG: CheR family methyltransferase [Myxococcota bacterium]
MSSPTPALSPTEFRNFASMLREICGIELRDGKEPLVHSRVGKRLRQLNLTSFSTYLQIVKTDEAELSRLVDILTTNKTSFFRENDHIDIFATTFVEGATGPLRIWSAGCSTGQEPYSLSMKIRAIQKGLDYRILATDLSTEVLARARSGSYSEQEVGSVPDNYRRMFFRRDGDRFQVSQELQAPIRFARLNLLGPWPMKGPFDAIFCRNVMIYFSQETRARLARRYAQLLRPGGYLFIGMSESLTSLDQPLEYISPAVYRR